MSDAHDAPPGGGARGRVYGWGGAVSAEAETVRARSVDDVRAAFARARREGRSVALRGTGCSYGDASIVEGGIVLDLTEFRRVLAFDPATGVVEAEPGATIKDLWTLGLPYGFWPPVVSGTMFPTLGGALGMNIHGKNSFAVGTIGEHVLDCDLLTPAGELLRLSPTENADVFRAAIGGAGLLGCFVRVRLKLKRVPGGRLKVSAYAPKNLGEMIALFERDRGEADYLVGWIDGFARGASLGRGIIHRGDYAGPEDDAEATATLALERQVLPDRIMGVLPRSWTWRLARPWVNDLGMRCVNLAKFVTGSLGAGKPPYLQSHVAFAFLLDYVPDWKKSYGRGGLIQYQSFVPAAEAERVHGTLIRTAQEAGIPPYLLVYKRHRRDPYVLTHSVDGYSMAMDFRVTTANRARLWALCRRFDDVVTGGGGRFYFAKDATLERASFSRSVPPEELDAFVALKRRLDPDGLLATSLSKRLFDFAAASKNVARTTPTPA
jgi:decaprenylphospho-beta-D-ribofuranose 2-oxidase